MPRWLTKRTEVVTLSRTDGSFEASVPLYDGTVKQLTVTFTMTADRALRVVCVNEPGAAGLSDFSAWSTS